MQFKHWHLTCFLLAFLLLYGSVSLASALTDNKFNTIFNGSFVVLIGLVLSVLQWRHPAQPIHLSSKERLVFVAILVGALILGGAIFVWITQSFEAHSLDPLLDPTNDTTLSAHWEQNDMCTFVPGKGYMLQVSHPQQANLTPCTESQYVYEDATTSVLVRVTGPGWGGLCLHLDPNIKDPVYIHAYCFLVDTSRHFHIFTQQYRTIAPPTSSMSINVGEGATNELKVIAQYPRLLFFVNGSQVFEIKNDPYHVSGTVGFVATSDTDPSTAVFSELEVFQDKQLWPIKPKPMEQLLTLGLRALTVLAGLLVVFWWGIAFVRGLQRSKGAIRAFTYGTMAFLTFAPLLLGQFTGALPGQLFSAMSLVGSSPTVLPTGTSSPTVPTVLPTPTPSLSSPTSRPMPVFADPLTPPSEANWDNTVPRCVLSANGLLIQTRSSEGFLSFCPLKQTPLTDNMTVMVRLEVSGNSGGLLVNTDQNHTIGYLFEINNSGQLKISVWGPDGGVLTNGFEKASAIRPGASNELKVVVIGPNLKFLVNNMLIYTVNNARYVGGRIALFVSPDGLDTQGRFTDFRIYSGECAVC